MSFTNKYVTTTGAGAKDGSSISNAMSWSELSTALTLGGTALPGDVYLIQEGTYTPAATSTWNIDGTVATPIILQGCLTDWTPIEPSRTSDNLRLVTTHLPFINLTGGNKRIEASGSSYIIYKSLKISSDYASVPALYAGPSSVVYGCEVINSANGGAGIRAYGDTLVINSDAATTHTTGAFAISLYDTNSRAIGCCVYDSGAQGIVANANYTLIAWNRIYGHTDYGIYCGAADTSYRATAIGNTIYGGKGLFLVDTAFGGLSVIINNHITDTSTAAFVGPTTAGKNIPIMFANNRVRNNTGGEFNFLATSEWPTAATWNNVTADNGTGISQDYVDAANGNLNLAANAPGRGEGLVPYNDIGALRHADPPKTLILMHNSE